jgi:hypothetical protein
MAKAIKVLNSYNELIAIVDNVKQALSKVEKFSGCSLADSVKPHSVNRDIAEHKSAVVFNAFNVAFHLESFEASAADVKREKQFLNVYSVSALFN